MNFNKFQFYHLERGSIFILCLWSLCLLSILAVCLGSKVSQDISLASYFKDKPQVHFLAEAAIKRAQNILKKDTNTFDSLNEFWSTGKDSDDGESIFKEAELGNGIYSIVRYASCVMHQEDKEHKAQGTEHTTQYGMVDEERKININMASQKIIERLFRVAEGLEIDKAHIIASSIVDWRDSNNNPLESGAEDSFYGQLEIPYECKDSNFQVLEELLLVRGMTDDIFQKIKDFITIYGDGKVNINTASYEVLYALSTNSVLVNKVIDYRKGRDKIEDTQDDNILKNQSNIANDLESSAGLNEEELNKIVELTSRGLLSVSSKNFTINTESKVGRRHELIVCVVNREKRVKYWRQY